MALTSPASRGVKKPKKHRDSVAKSVATSVLKNALAEQTLPSMRAKVAAAVRELETPETIARKRAASFRNISALSEQGIWEADQKQTAAFRVVCRMLRAGQPFSYLGNSKKVQCVTDIGRLLGYLYDAKTFPVRGGRSFIAGVLSTLLGRPVSLVDIIRWFPVRNSQDMTVHQELLDLLSPVGRTWPPNAHLFPECTVFQSYKAISKPAAGLVQACESVQTSTSLDESATFVEEMSALLWNPGMGGTVVPHDSSFGTNPDKALEDDMQDLA